MKLLPEQPVGGGTDTDSSTLSQLQTVAADLHQTTSPTQTYDALSTRRGACERARELAEECPNSGRRLAPMLVAILKTELDRESSSASEHLFFESVSREIQRNCAQALASIAGPALVHSYEQSEYSLATLTETLATTLRTSGDTETKQWCARALAALHWVRPAHVTSTLELTSAAVSIGKLLPTERPISVGQACGQLLFAFGHQAPSTVGESCPVEEWQQGLRELDDETCSLYAQLLEEYTTITTDASANELPASPTIKALIAAVCADESTHQRSARQLGTIAALFPDQFEHLPDAVLQRLRNATDEDRRRVTRAAGEVVASEARPAASRVPHLLTQVQETTGTARRREAAVLGEVALAFPNRFESPPAELIEQLQTTDTPDEQALAAIGTCLLTTDREESLRKSLRTAVLESSNESRRWAAVTLGEWIAAAPAQFSIEHLSLVDRVHSQTGEQREAAAFALGFAQVIAESPHVDPEAVVQTSTADGQARTARVVGELIIAQPARISPVARPQLEPLAELSGHARHRAVQALGIAVAHAPETCDSPVSVLRDWASDAPAGAYADRLQLLGDWVRAVPECAPAAPDSVISRVQECTDSDRDRAAQTFGELVVTMGPTTEPSVDGILSTVPWRGAIHACSLQTLRTVIESDDSAYLNRSEFTGENPDWPLVAAGEYRASVGDAPSESLSSLHEAVRQQSGWDRQLATRAYGWALAVTSETLSYSRQRLVQRLRTATSGRRATAYILGEVVAAASERVSDPPPTLADQVRNATGFDRILLARTLGEVIATTPPGDSPSHQRLVDRVSTSTGDTRRHHAQVLGIAVTVVSDWTVSAPQSLIDAVAEVTGRDRQAIARVLGERITDPSSASVLDRLSPGADDGSVFERARRGQAIRALARTEVISVQQLLATLSFSSESSQTASTIGHVLQLREPIRETVLEALAESLRSNPADDVELHGPLSAALEKNQMLSSATRLVIVDILAHIDYRSK